MLSSRVVCSVGLTTSWFVRLTSSPSRLREHVGPLTPAAQTTSSDGIEIAVGSLTPSSLTSTTRGRPGFHVEPAQDVGGRLGDALGQSGQDAVRRLDQRDLDVLVGVDLVEAEGDETARRLMQLGGKLGTGGAGADDRHVQLPGAHRARCAYARTQALISRRLKRSASSGVSSMMACSFTPGVLKALPTQPMAMTRVSYLKARIGVISRPSSS